MGDRSTFTSSSAYWDEETMASLVNKAIAQREPGDDDPVPGQQVGWLYSPALVGTSRKGSRW